MDLRNCPRCGKIFAYDGKNKICNVCKNSEENEFQKVKDFLWDNPNATIEEVHNATEVERDLIIKFVREGRLVAEGLSFDFMIECERCGTPISSGRYCDKCQETLVEGFHTGPDKKKRPIKKRYDSKGKMFLQDRIEKRNR